MTNPFVINGRFLCQQTTGVQRFAREVVAELDKITEKGRYILACPSDVDDDAIRLENIDVKKVGQRPGFAWEQYEYPLFVENVSGLSVNLCNSAPLVCPDVVCVHDATFRVMPSTFSRLFVFWYRLLVSRYQFKSKTVLTVSDFSRSELERYYPRLAGRIRVVPNGWEHMNRIDGDKAALSERGLEESGFYFSIGSLTENRNIGWIVQTAKLNPDNLFCVAGSLSSSALRGHGLDIPENVRLLGRITDKEMKALMTGCRAFIAPSRYEGFGIPPLEALSCGASLLLSDIPVFHEIYQNAATYFDPDVPLRSIDQCVAQADAREVQKVLDEYTWANSAKRVDLILRKILMHSR